MKVLLSLSGGLDSTCLLAHLVKQGAQVETVSFNYGSKHNASEINAAQRIAERYQVSHTVIDLRHAMAGFKSDLLQTGGPIPHGHYEHESMRRTVVPGRNLIFASILIGLAESRGLEYVALGVHQGDHYIYPDCRPDFVNALAYTSKLATEGKVDILAPFLTHTKADIVAVGHTLNVPFELTRTCYEGGMDVACGKCGSCTERLEAFASNGLTDPILYLTDTYPRQNV